MPNRCGRSWKASSARADEGEFALAAQRDLFAVEAFVGVDSPASAARLISRLRAATDRLADLPHIGRAGEKPGTYELVTVRPYVIVYVVETERVVVERIFHGAQLR